MKPIISPSILSADFGYLARDIEMINESAVSYTHLDVYKRQVLLGCMPVTAFAQKQFFFKDGRFVVAQFTDLHWMPGSATVSYTHLFKK